MQAMVLAGCFGFSPAADSAAKEEAREILQGAAATHRELAGLPLFLRAEIEISEWFRADPLAPTGEEVTRRWRVDTVMDRSSGACVSSTTRLSNRGADGELIDVPRTAHAYRLSYEKEGTSVLPTVPPIVQGAAVFEALVNEDGRLADPIEMMGRFQGEPVSQRLESTEIGHLLSPELPFEVSVTRVGQPPLARIDISLPGRPETYSYECEQMGEAWYLVKASSRDTSATPARTWGDVWQWTSYATPNGGSVRIPSMHVCLQTDESVKLRDEMRMLRADVEFGPKPIKSMEEEAAARAAQAHFEGTLEGLEARRRATEPSSPAPTP